MVLDDGPMSEPALTQLANAKTRSFAPAVDAVASSSGRAFRTDSAGRCSAALIRRRLSARFA